MTVESKDTKGCFPWTFLHKNQKVYRAEQDSRVGWRPQNRQPVRQNKSLEPVWYGCLKIENCCLKKFVEIRVGEKVC